MSENQTNTFDLDTLNSTEQLVLGAAMKSPNALPDILVNLTRDDFNQAKHKLIYEAIINLNQENKEISELTVIDQLEKANKLAQAGNSSYILEIANHYYTDQGIETYIGRVYEASQGRKFRGAVTKVNQLLKDNRDLHSALEYAQTEFIDIDFDLKKSDTIAIGQSAYAVIEKTKKFSQMDNHLTGVSTGYARLDAITGGFQSGDLIILAARPSMGKTAFALNLAYNAATTKMQQNSVAIFSIEMPSEQLTQRILSSMTTIPADKLRNGKGIDQNGWTKLSLANDQLNKTKIFIDDTPGITIQQIQSKLFKLKRDEKVNLAIIDYLQLISIPGSSGNDRQNEISTISRQLKRIARETGIPIVCLSQLSRSVEKREDKRPIMSDLRDSGAIEQDADMIIFLYRDEYYTHNKEEQENDVSLTDLIISKHRNGATGNINLSFLKKIGKFIDL